jgi:hypothetical protein
VSPVDNSVLTTETKPLEPTLAGVCTFANGSAVCGSGASTAYSPLHVTTICGEMLAQAAKTLSAHPGARILVVGHRNPSELSSLAQERTTAVAVKLTQEYGVSADLIQQEVGTPGNRIVELFLQ